MLKALPENFLLKNETAKKLYNDYAKNMPIIDYHCHVSPQEMYENKTFNIVKTNTGFELSIKIDDELETYTGNIATPTVIKTPEGDINISVESLPTAGHNIKLTKLSP